jgi:phospholipid/cholesterol/gamma-HCH transport system permease protein
MTLRPDRRDNLKAETKRDGDTLIVRLAGRLDVNTTGGVWKKLVREASSGAANMRIEASELEYCDGAGSALLLEIQRIRREQGRRVEIVGLADQFSRILQHLHPDQLEPAGTIRFHKGIFAGTGVAVLNHLRDIRDQVSFLGKVASAVTGMVTGSGGALRWSDVLRSAENIGADSVPLIALTSALVGFVVALDAGDALQPFGAQTLTPKFVTTALAKELAPLLTAVVVIGRTTSAFAAELGSMRMNEETDALEVMGLDPVPFLVVGRILACGAVLPLMAAFFTLFGLVGGAVACHFFGVNARLFMDQIRSTVTVGIVVGAILKSILYGLLAGGVGCYCGLTSERDAEAVAHSATRAVVTGLIVISVTDAALALLFHYLGL